MESLASQEEDLIEMLRLDDSDFEAKEEKKRCGSCGIIIWALLVILVSVGVLAATGRAMSRRHTIFKNVEARRTRAAMRHAPLELFHKNHSNVTRYRSLVLSVDEPGDNKSFPKAGDTVVVKYNGTLADGGFLFDTSRDHGGNMWFIVGQGSVIEGWEEAIQNMSLNETATLHVPSRLAYGEKGLYPAIPKDADLDFQIHLVTIRAAPEFSWNVWWHDHELEFTVLGLFVFSVCTLGATLSFVYKDYACAACFWWMRWNRRRRIARTRDRRLAHFNAGS